MSRPFEGMLLLGLGAAFWCARRKQFGAALSILLWAHWSLQCGRNIPVFLLISAPFTACMASEFLASVSAIRRFKRACSVNTNASRDFHLLDRAPRLHLVSLAALLLIASGFAWETPGFEAQFNPKNFPVRALPFIRSAKFSHLFTTDQWADYLIYHLYPAQRTYIDGRSDMFGADFAERYRNVLSARHDWEANLRADGVDAVMLHPDTPVVSALKESKNWKLLFDNGYTVIFQAISTAQPPKWGVIEPVQVSPVANDGRKRLGRLSPSTPLNLNTRSQERKS